MGEWTGYARARSQGAADVIVAATAAATGSMGRDRDVCGPRATAVGSTAGSADSAGPAGAVGAAVAAAASSAAAHVGPVLMAGAVGRVKQHQHHRHHTAAAAAARAKRNGDKQMRHFATLFGRQWQKERFKVLEIDSTFATRDFANSDCAARLTSTLLRISP